MSEFLASRCEQMLHDLAILYKDESMVSECRDDVMVLLTQLRKLENLLSHAYNNIKILDHFEAIRRHAARIEDVLEHCAVVVEYELMSRKEKGKRGIRRLLKGYLHRRLDSMCTTALYAMFLVTDVRAVAEDLDEIFPDDEMEIVGEEECSRMAEGRSTLRRPMEIYYGDDHMEEEHFVGMEEELNELISLVDRFEEEPRVVSIWGVEGSGKTALARKVYIHSRLKSTFKACFAWVSVGQDYEIGELLQDMLKQLLGGGGTVSNEDKNDMTTKEIPVVDQLKEIQRYDSCLIVIDGISEISQWKEISCAFLLEGADTRILLTTRDETLAGELGSPYKLRLLNDDEGWELLNKYAFRGKKPPELGIVPKLGKEMVRKCDHLPLRISILGRSLSKIPLNEWHMVNDDVDGYLEMECQAHSQSNKRSDLPNYYHLSSYYLSQCFLYLGIFKDDVDSEDLTFLWNVEGMISSEKLMQTSERYLRELGSKGLLKLQADELSANRRFMPLSLRNHAREVSLYQGERELFGLKVVGFSGGKHPRFDMHETKRLVIHFDKLSSRSKKDHFETNKLRSLLFINSDQEFVDLPIIPHFSTPGVAPLRVLHFVRCKFEDRKLPEWVVELSNLRYLGIIYCDLDQLPKSISNLRNLCVLNIRSYGDAKITIPNELSQLIWLKHLRLPNHSDHEESDKLKLDGLVDLETLVGFNPEIHDLNSLSSLKKLRLLVAHAYSNKCLISIIKFLSDYGRAQMRTSLFIEYRCNFIEEEGLAVLEEVLMCPNVDALTFSMVLIPKFPNCGIYASSSLTEIKLIGCKLIEDPMKALGKFLNLRKLCLGYGSFVGRRITHQARGFQNLEYLELRCLPVEEWYVVQGALSKLSDLTVRQCPKLKGIPEGLASVYSLKNLEIELAATALADGKKAEYYQKFVFVESINIRELVPFSTRNDGAY